MGGGGIQNSAKTTYNKIYWMTIINIRDPFK